MNKIHFVLALALGALLLAGCGAGGGDVDTSKQGAAGPAEQKVDPNSGNAMGGPSQATTE